MIGANLLGPFDKHLLILLHDLRQHFARDLWVIPSGNPVPTEGLLADHLVMPAHCPVEPIEGGGTQIMFDLAHR